jgi:hypothetical protein
MSGRDASLNATVGVGVLEVQASVVIARPFGIRITNVHIQFDRRHRLSTEEEAFKVADKLRQVVQDTLVSLGQAGVNSDSRSDWASTAMPRTSGPMSP